MNIGDKVVCRLYNSVDKAYYGEEWIGEILQDEIFHREGKSNRPILVTRPDYPNIWLSRREVREIDA